MKKLNKLVAILVAMAMVLSLSIIAAFADDPEPAVPQTPLANAKLTKQLNTPAGIANAPTILATFAFDLDVANSSGLTDAEKALANDEVKTAGTIEIADQTISLTGVANTTTTETKNVSAFTPTFNHAGVYAYTVTEKDPAKTAPAAIVNDANAKVTKDNVTYTLRYYVTPKTTGTGDEAVTTYTVDYVTVNRNANSQAGDAGKVDASKTDADGFTFVNNYEYTDGEEPQNPEGPVTPEEKAKFALVVEKEVTNNAGDTQGFPIQVKLDKALGQTETEITGIVYKAGENGNYVKDRDETFTYGTEKTITLKTGEWLGFAELPTGTVWSASELLNNQTAFLVYTPSYAGVANDTAISGNAGAGQTLATSEYTLQEAKKDNVKYTNAYDNAINTPTGILISNLPYIALALVAIGGLVAYVVVRRRQDDEA